MILNCLIVCKSLTYAQRAKRVITRAGFHGSVLRLPSDVTGSGCGYALRVSEQELGQILITLREHDFPSSRVYTQFEDGTLREIRK